MLNAQVTNITMFHSLNIKFPLRSSGWIPWPSLFSDHLSIYLSTYLSVCLSIIYLFIHFYLWIFFQRYSLLCILTFRFALKHRLKSRFKYMYLPCLLSLQMKKMYINNLLKFVCLDYKTGLPCPAPNNPWKNAPEGNCRQFSQMREISCNWGP